MKKIILSILLLSSLAISANESDYVFGWSHLENPNLKIPRGGTTTGPEVSLDSQPSSLWEKMQNPKLSKLEKDRLAILSMAGKYRVYFDFMETMGFVENYQPKQPYQSWATEFVEVVDEKKDFISLQHIIVMYFKQDDGSISYPVVMKHWRQDWKYEDSEINTFIGNKTWVKNRIPWMTKKGTWSQAAYQVDDTPRYQSYGKWTHSENFSSWTSKETWRPLPRREFSVRDDYDVMIGTNIQTITPTGWVHEQNNKKVVLNKNHKVLAKEIGIARYERIKDFDWSAGDNYWKNTKIFWGEVREAWNKELDNSKIFKIQSEVDGEILFSKLFMMADQYEEGETEVLKNIEDIVKTHSTTQK
ncbi:MAG: hypothetical protein P8K73_05550 [Methylophilaceae bacterium]|jgi:hypothetical protein|nr:hypothetical protein [Methylophilaceae bacterium]